MSDSLSKETYCEKHGVNLVQNDFCALCARELPSSNRVDTHPCPFCGCPRPPVACHLIRKDGKLVTDKHFVQCPNAVCGAQGPSCGSYEEAEAAWNLRALSANETTATQTSYDKDTKIIERYAQMNLDADGRIERILARASFPKGRADDDASYVLYLLADGEISVGKALEWLREYIASGRKGPLPEPRSSEEPTREHLHWCAIRIGKGCNCRAEKASGEPSDTDLIEAAAELHHRLEMGQVDLDAEAKRALYSNISRLTRR